MAKDITDYVKKCPECQRFKITGKKSYGKLPLTTFDRSKPWDVVHVDMIGLWTVNFTQVRDNVTTTIKVKAITMVERATSWSEFAVARTVTVEHVALLFDNGWLCRYPRPKIVVHDNGGEFNGFEIQETMSSYTIIAKPTTVKNPCANSVAERVHLTMTDMSRTQEFSRHDWFEVMDQLLQSVIIMDWEYLKDKHRKSSRIANESENKSRPEKVYKKGDKVLIVLDRMDRGAKFNSHWIRY